MEPSGLSGAMFSSINSSLLGVDNPLHQQQQQNPHHLHHPQMVYAAHHETDPHPQHHHQKQQIKQGYSPYSSKNKQPHQTTLSDEDEPGFTAAEDGSGDPTKRKISPWQRMKWTDTMVRLLIMAVYYIGDEGGSEGSHDATTMKKSSTGLLQKKGKWKSVSRAMMEKGFYVSPQQCEDKFNDLNKRYKRVNDILGKGTACRVVENQKLLDTMDLSPKMKEEVKKLLNSKHLFFREMCAYHNSCGHGNTSGGVSSSTPPQQVEAGAEGSHTQQQQQGCFHSSANGVGNLGGSGSENMGMLKMGCGEEDDDEDDCEDDESEDSSNDDDEDESGEGGSRGQVRHRHEDEEDENDGKSSRKRLRKSCVSSSQLMHEFSSEVSGVFQDGGKSLLEKKQWIRRRIMQLEEQKISYLSQAFDLEKQRLKWSRYSSKKEREMEKAKLENERRRLENERMVLIIRQKEIEFLNQQQQQQHSST